jgi:hypothetical protein
MKRHTSLKRYLHVTATLFALPLLAGAKGGGCSSNVPVGVDNEPAVCGAGACNGLEQTLEAKVCSDGSSVGRSVCAKKEDGTCFWDFPACPVGNTDSCSPAECTNLPVPTDAKICPDGTLEGRTVCVRGGDQQCFWDFPPCPVDAGAPGACKQSDCAGLPVQDDAKVCPDGTGLGRTVCATRSDGTCFWDFPACPTPIPMDASDCGCVPDMQWGMNGGFTPYEEATLLTACEAYRHERRQFTSNGTVLVASCDLRLIGCGSGVRSGRDILTALDHPDVQNAVTAGNVLYGYDARPVDGQVLRIQVGGAVIDVGADCGAHPNCTPVPSGVRALADLLQQIDQQELRLEPCATAFPVPFR